MSVKKSILDNADDGLPALNHAVDLQKEAAKVGFDWPDIRGVAAKIHEELDEVLAEIGTDDNQQRLSDEMGDLLFACTNLARHLNIDPDQALRAGNQKFYRRFFALEQTIRQSNSSFQELNLQQLDAIWDDVKRQEKLITPSKKV